MTWLWDGPGHITITFYGYGADIRPSLARFCTTQAIKDALDNHHSVWNQAIGESELQYMGRDPLVVLSVLPRAGMTWDMLFYTALMVQHFMEDFQAMALYFEAEITGVQGLVAQGNMTAFPDHRYRYDK